jgi:hypothetical protein
VANVSLFLGIVLPVFRQYFAECGNLFPKVAKVCRILADSFLGQGGTLIEGKVRGSEDVCFNRYKYREPYSCPPFEVK